MKLWGESGKPQIRPKGLLGRQVVFLYWFSGSLSSLIRKIGSSVKLLFDLSEKESWEFE